MLASPETKSFHPAQTPFNPINNRVYQRMGILAHLSSFSYFFQKNQTFFVFSICIFIFWL
jgi:hypothetical protein